MWNQSDNQNPEEEPVFPPFPTTSDEVWDVLGPYYDAGIPLDFFFEFFVMDVIGALPPVTVEAMDAFSAENPEAFGPGWRENVRTMLALSESIDVAILDMWYRELQSRSLEDGEYHPWQFALDFSAAYLADDSAVDTWSHAEYQEAKARVAEIERRNAT